MKLATIPTTGLAEFVAELARQHGVFYIRTPNDALAKVITRLAEDDVITDGTEDLIVALKRAHVIDAASMVSLHGNYLDEKQAIERAPQLFRPLVWESISLALRNTMALPIPKCHTMAWQK